MSYDDPNVLVQRELHIAGATTTAEIALRFRHFQEIRLKNLRAYVLTAGTSTVGAHYGLAIGTGAIAAGTSAAGVGTIDYSSNAAGFSGTLALNTNLTAAQLVRIYKGTAADGQVDMILDYQIVND